MDLLSHVLRELRFESAGYRHLELQAPWSISFAQAELRGMHLVLAGRCELVLENGTVFRLGPGDLVLAPRADPHLLRSPGATLRPTPSTHLAEAAVGERIHSGAGGDRTAILCGAFLVGNRAHPALAGLPHIIHVPAEAGARDWLDAFQRLLEVEGGRPGPGSELVVSRLSDALLARALRFEVNRAGEGGWLRALRDPVLARALGAMHDRVEAPWTLASVARHAGVSRAVLARRFADQVGQSPMRYLLGLRMARAMALLGEGHHALAAIAARTGYGSEAAFSTAFKRVTGVSPSAYRKRGPVPLAVPDPGARSKTSAQRSRRKARIRSR
ncbi:MAG TPA: AraC family transcriptional regulator [Myxococcaceae bacterium]|nr:AraC family transcriptional regulator [Myxococcaceae bacterium]